MVDGDAGSANDANVTAVACHWPQTSTCCWPGRVDWNAIGIRRPVAPKSILRPRRACLHMKVYAPFYNLCFVFAASDDDDDHSRRWDLCHYIIIVIHLIRFILWRRLLLLLLRRFHGIRAAGTHEGLMTHKSWVVMMDDDRQWVMVAIVMMMLMMMAARGQVD